jgi:hypothetical protein
MLSVHVSLRSHSIAHHRVGNRTTDSRHKMGMVVLQNVMDALKSRPLSNLVRRLPLPLTKLLLIVLKPPGAGTPRVKGMKSNGPHRCSKKSDGIALEC